MGDHFADRNVGTTSRLRLRGHDYSQAGTYFITCTAVDRAPLFGEVRGNRFRASMIGEAVLEEWNHLVEAYPALFLDDCQLMPDHFHGVLTLPPGNDGVGPSLSAIIGRFKSLSARRYWRIRDAGQCMHVGTTCWQDRFHDTIIRNDRHYNQLITYISLNPRRWTQKHGE